MSGQLDGRPGDVNKWFFPFIFRHMQRCKHEKWPKMIDGLPSEEAIHFFHSWMSRFIKEGVTEQVAEVASAAMAETKWPFPGGEHLDVLMRHVAASWDVLRARGAGTSHDQTREGAQARSRTCPECSGDGRTMRRREIAPGRVYSFAFYCLCPAGEWFANNHFHKCRDVFDRTRRLVQYPELWDGALDHPTWPRRPEPRGWAAEPGWIPPEPYLIDMTKYRSIDERQIGAMPD